jgi:hypothetical protein
MKVQEHKNKELWLKVFDILIGEEKLNVPDENSEILDDGASGDCPELHITGKFLNSNGVNVSISFDYEASWDEISKLQISS